MNYLLDTCVINELISTHPNPDVIGFVDSLEQEEIYLSVITVGEITKGIHLLPNSERKRQLETWLRDAFLARFDGHILPLDTKVFMRWGELSANLERLGLPPASAMDSLIAATALTHQMVLVTMHEDDFRNTQLEIVNPW
ncbi:MAG: type II toxin-antitoxin system VapC family toxin [Chloroflexi bacterium]|nr:type II toxin-antitoxin system VapC family toxin [Chloroflexota bacterium]